MLSLRSSPLYLAILVYLVIAISTYYLRPSFFFDEAGNPKELGLDESESIISYPLFLVLLGGFLYLLTLVVTNVLNKI